MLSTDLAAQTADLLAIANISEPRALDRLVNLAALQVPACSGADAAGWLQQGGTGVPCGASAKKCVN